MDNHLILLVDDEPAILEMLVTIFTQAGYTNLATASDGAGALAQMRRKMPDLVILDVMLPDTDGFSLLRAIRAVGRTPVLMLTARGEAGDRIAGLEQGADDYLVKPFLPRELLLRGAGAAAPRLPGSEPAGAALQLPWVDLGDATVRRPDRPDPLPLTAKEYAIFSKLAENAGRIVTIGTLCETACGEIWQGYESTLMTHIRHLREKIEADPSAPQSLLTVRGLGYKLVLEEGR